MQNMQSVIAFCPTIPQSKQQQQHHQQQQQQQQNPVSSTSEKKYRCSLCLRAFSRSEHRTRHERSHTKERPFKCPKCESTFVRRDLLLRHERTVHAKKQRAKEPSTTSKKTASKPRDKDMGQSPGGSDDGSDDTSSRKSYKKDNDDQIQSSDRRQPESLRTHGDADNPPNPYSSEHRGNDDMDMTVAVLMTGLQHGNSNGSNQPNHHGETPAFLHPREQPPVHMHSPLPPPHIPDQHAHQALEQRHHNGHESNGYGGNSDSHFFIPKTDQNQRHYGLDESTRTLNNSNYKFQIPSINDSGAVYDNPNLRRRRGSSFSNLLNEIGQPNGNGNHLNGYRSYELNGLNNIFNTFGPPENGSAVFNSRHSSNSSNGNHVEDNELPSITNNTAANNTTMHLTRCAPPRIVSEYVYRVILENAAQIDREGNILSKFNPPSITKMNNYLLAYHRHYHPANPLLHLPTFDAAKSPPWLLFIIAAIGALYYRDETAACDMCDISGKLTDVYFRMNAFNSRNCPLTLLQSLTLTLSFATLRGTPEGLEIACQIRARVLDIIRGTIFELSKKAHQPDSATNTNDEPIAQWIEKEETIRTVYSAYVIFSIMCSLYNLPPALDTSELGDLKMPCEEDVWNANIRDVEVYAPNINRSEVYRFSQVYSTLYEGNYLHFAEFSSRIMIAALSLDLWQIKASSGSLWQAKEFSSSKLNTALTAWERSVLYLLESGPLQESKSCPLLIVNAYAVHRLCQVRLLANFSGVGSALRYFNRKEIFRAVTDLSRQVVRSPASARAAGYCLDAVRDAGLLMSDATLPAVSGAELLEAAGILCLYLIIWVYKFERDMHSGNGIMTREEEDILKTIRQQCLNDPSCDGGVESGRVVGTNGDNDSIKKFPLSMGLAKRFYGRLEVASVWGVMQVYIDTLRTIITNGPDKCFL